MKVRVNGQGVMVFSEIYNNIRIETDTGSKASLCIRDGEIEIVVNRGPLYRSKGPYFEVLHPSLEIAPGLACDCPGQDVIGKDRAR